jgi:hypothetical protein
MVQHEVSRPGPHPEPPPDLPSRSLPILTIDCPWVRSHPAQYEPIFFGRSGDNRFDAPRGDYGVLYVARDVEGAFAETFGRRLEYRAVTMAALRNRLFTAIHALRPLRLVDLTGPGLARIGADGRLATGDYVVAQRWSEALFQHPDRPDGLYYRSRHDPGQECAAIFDRVARLLSIGEQRSLVDPAHHGLLATLLDTFGFSLIEGSQAES